jgi:hypothetical protein
MDDVLRSYTVFPWRRPDSGVACVRATLNERVMNVRHRERFIRSQALDGGERSTSLQVQLYHEPPPLLTSIAFRPRWCGHFAQCLAGRLGQPCWPGLCELDLELVHRTYSHALARGRKDVCVGRVCPPVCVADILRFLHVHAPVLFVCTVGRCCFGARMRVCVCVHGRCWLS